MSEGIETDNWGNEDVDILKDLYFSFVEFFPSIDKEKAEKAWEEDPEQCRENAKQAFNKMGDL